MTIARFIEQAGMELKSIYDERELQNVMRLAVEETLNISPAKYFISLQNELSDTEEKKLAAIVKRLMRNEPAQHVLGKADFYGMNLKVNRHVLIPRPETEELADHVIKMLKALPAKGKLSVLDVGTGSGCIALAIKKNVPHAMVTAMDASSRALAVAKKNAEAEKVSIDFLLNDFLDESAWEKLNSFDVIVSNPPYITQREFDEISKRVKDFEPRMALMAKGSEPFIFYEKLARFGKKHLKKGGWIAAELNSTHAGAIASLFSAASYKVSVQKDLQGKERILISKII